MKLLHWEKIIIILIIIIIIISWMNSLNLIDEPISRILDISNGVFWGNLLNKLYTSLNKHEDEHWENVPTRNLISRYLEKEFAEYLNEAELDLLRRVIASLFLFASCIKHDMSWAKLPLCHLDDEMQIQIKDYMETMIQIKCHTRHTVKHAITQIKGEEEPVISVCKSPPNKYAGTPKVSSKNTLKDFFELEDSKVKS